ALDGGGRGQAQVGSGRGHARAGEGGSAAGDRAARADCAADRIGDDPHGARGGLRRARSRRLLAGAELVPGPAAGRRAGSDGGRARAADRGRPMSARILSASQALPPHYVAQATLLAAFRAHWGRKHFNRDRLEQLHRAVQVGGRHLALPLGDYEALESFAARNAAWTRVAVEVGEDAVRKALLAADV